MRFIVVLLLLSMLGCSTSRKIEDPLIVHGMIATSVTGSVIQETDQARYVGYVKNGQPHGQGTMYLKNKMILIGEWNQGELSGSGIIISIDLDNLAVGNFDQGVQQGKGYLTANGVGFHGEILNGVPSGVGDCYQKAQKTLCDPLKTP